jgi:hypothetical protein
MAGRKADGVKPYKKPPLITKSQLSAVLVWMVSTALQSVAVLSDNPSSLA